MTSLYQLTHDFAVLRDLEATADTSDIQPEAILDALEAIEGELIDKATSVAKLARNLETTGKAIREAAAAMLERAERVERRADSVRAWLLLCMQREGIKKIEAPEFRIAVRDNPGRVIIDDEQTLPLEWYIKPNPPPPRIDKMRIRKALLDGETVPGCHLFADQRLEIKEK